MIKTNFHTHTTFCDGRDTPEQMVESAIQKGFSALGFSGHAYFVLDAAFTMDLAQQKPYRAEILRLKEKYKNEIDIFLGIEQDSWSPALDYKYDYVIASVHNVQKDGVYCPVDNTLEIMKSNLDRYFGGDMDAFAEAYFEETVRLFDKIPEGDIIGHIDLVTKYDEQLSYRRTPRYFRMAKQAIAQLAKYGRPFEINTGAMGRGYRSAPYPDPELLRAIRREGCPIVINSDCHNKDYLDCGFAQAVALARDCGFDSHMVLTKQGWESRPLP